MLTELVTRPISAVVALVELPLTMRRSLEQANELMETSRRQLEQMQRQTDDALEHAERLNDLLTRVVRLTEPIEKAQRGGEFAAGIAKRVIFGEAEQLQRAADDAEAVADDADRAAEEVEVEAEELPNRPSTAE